MIAQAMLYTVAVGGPVLLAAAIGAAYLRRHGRAERGVWIGALVLSLAMPFGMMTREEGSTAGHSRVLAATYVVERPTAEAPEPLGGSRPGAEPSVVLAALWLLASLALAARWAVSGVRLTRISRSWSVALLEGAEVHLTDDFGPAVTGVLQPRIVIPTWVADLPAERRRLVVGHEVEHLRARDQLVIAAGRLARVLTPWNPAVWVLHSKLSQAVELDCDRRVLRSYPDVACYGETLLAVSAGSRGLVAAAFAESHVPLRRRILAMTTPPIKLKLVGSLGVVALGAALLAGAMRLPVPRMELSLDAPVRALAAILRAPQEATLPRPRVIDPRRPALVLTPPVGDSVPLTIRFLDGQVVTIRAPELDSLANATNGRLLIQWDPRFGMLPQPPESITSGPRILNPREVIAATAAAYPARLRELGVVGTVAVQFLVTETGAVERTRVGQVSMYPDFDRAALEVAETYRFSPAELDGEPVPVWVIHPVIFRLD